MDNGSEDVDPTAKYWVYRWEYHPMPWEVAIITSVVSGLLALVGALANGLVMYLIISMIKRFQQLETLDILILSLCFSDLLSSVVVQPILIPRILLRTQVARLHSVMLHASAHFTLVLGSLSLLCITLSRYLSVQFPFYYSSYVTETKIYGCLATIFTTAVAMVIWVVLHGQSESATFPIIISVIFSSTMILQIMIFTVVFAQNRNMRRQIQAVEHNRSSNDVSLMTRRTNAQRSKANSTILYICAVFILTWLPSIIFRVFYVIHGNLTFYIQWLHMFNVVIQLHSCINPFIYVLRTSRVKQILSRIFQRQ